MAGLNPVDPGALARLRALLMQAVRDGRRPGYQALAVDLGLGPPRQIQQLAALLEALMREQAATGEPQLAALACARLRDGLPAPGYFQTLAALGLYAGPDAGPAAAAAHAAELQRCRDWVCGPGERNAESSGNLRREGHSI